MAEEGQSQEQAPASTVGRHAFWEQRRGEMQESPAGCKPLGLERCGCLRCFLRRREGGTLSCRQPCNCCWIDLTTDLRLKKSARLLRVRVPPLKYASTSGRRARCRHVCLGRQQRSTFSAGLSADLSRGTFLDALMPALQAMGKAVKRPTDSCEGWPI